MLNVLSIQSEIVRGHVGNGAARFALQRMGLNVWAVPSVLLSNHPGHGKVRGETISPQQMSALVDGLGDHGWLAQCDGVISGYLGDAAQTAVVAEAVRKVKAVRPTALYLCDPVFGDEGGAYAKRGVAEAMARDLLPLADIVTPNRFELASLTSRKVSDAASAIAAARELGRAEVVVTSVPFDGERIGTVAVTGAGVWGAAAPRLQRVPHGSGDLFAAMYFGHRLKGTDAAGALRHAASAVDAVLRASVAAQADEMTLVACQDETVRPSRLLEVQRLP